MTELSRSRIRDWYRRTGQNNAKMGSEKADREVQIRTGKCRIGQGRVGQVQDRAEQG